MITCTCNCGAVEFELGVVPTAIFTCHCSICRRFSGAAGVSVVVVDNAQFKWLKGEEEVQVWRKPGADWEANFCRRCGSSLPGRNDDRRKFVPAGLLPGHLEGLEVQHHIFVGSKADWDVIGDSGTQHTGPFSED